jgi:DNA-binding response OmpR family regulator
VRVLVVEDDATVAQLLDELLRGEGYEPVHTTTRAQALRAAANGPWRAIVTDGTGSSYLEPGEDDRAFFGELARHGRVIVNTARAWANRVTPAELGVAAVLPKPYDVDRLLELIAACS